MVICINECISFWLLLVACDVACRWSVNIGALDDIPSTSMDSTAEPVALSSSRSKKKRGPTSTKSKVHNSVLGEVGLLGMAANNSSKEESAAPPRKRTKAVPSEASESTKPAAGGRRGSTRSHKTGGGGSDSLFSLK